MTKIEQRHILVKGCGKFATDPDLPKRDQSSSAAIETGPASPKLEGIGSVHSTQAHAIKSYEDLDRIGGGGSARLEHSTIQSSLDSWQLRPTSSNEVDVPGPCTSGDPYTSSQEPTVSNLVKLLERIIDDAKKKSENGLGEYIEAWTGFDLSDTELLRQLRSPVGFSSPTARTKAVTKYVHAILVVAQWKEFVRYRESGVTSSHHARSRSSRGNIGLRALSGASDQDDSTHMIPEEQNTVFTAFPNSLKKLWFFEVANRTVDAFLYRWNMEHGRWLQYRWNAACAIYYCKLHIDGK
jgi:hypothetical protein